MHAQQKTFLKEKENIPPYFSLFCRGIILPGLGSDEGPGSGSIFTDLGVVFVSAGFFLTGVFFPGDPALARKSVACIYNTVIKHLVTTYNIHQVYPIPVQYMDKSGVNSFKRIE